MVSLAGDSMRIGTPREAPPLSNVVYIEERTVVQVVTVAKFRRPPNPRRCNARRFHVWRWRGGPIAPGGLTCQCGLLEGAPAA